MKLSKIHPAWWLSVAVATGLLLLTQVTFVNGQSGFRDQLNIIRSVLTGLGFPEPNVKEASQGAQFPETATLTSTMPVAFKPGVVQTFVRMDLLTAGNAQANFENDSKFY